MALLFIESFDHEGTSFLANPGGLGKWGVGDGAANTSSPRTGTHALRFPSTGSLTTKPYTTSGGVVVGVAILMTGAFVAVNLIEVIEGAIIHVAVAITTGGLLTVKRGTTVLATGTTVLSLSNWHYIELKATISDTGSYEVHIDGVAEAALTNAGPVDTQNAGTGIWDRIKLTGIGGMTIYYDDFYLCDTSGSAPQNTFLGTVKVEMLLPQTDAVAIGSNTGLTPSTSTDHGALVDETTPNTTDYNSGSTVGLKDTYNYPAMTLTGTVYGVQTNLYVAKSDASARQVCAVVRSNSVDYDGANVSPLTTFQYYSEMRQVDPNTSAAWTTANIASIQAGMKVTV